MIVDFIASGSDGNCTYVIDGDTSILIDCGIAIKKIKYKVDAILTSHDHIDHCGTVDRYMRKYKNCGIRNIVSSAFNPNSTFVEKQYITRVDFFKERPFFIKTMEIEAGGLIHDTPNFFFIINKKYIHLTDTGLLPKMMLLHHLQQYPIEVIFLESNYDEVLLDQSEYDEFLKYRIKSKVGHLSNQKVLKFLSDNEDKFSNIKYIVLGHLSELTNSTDALQTQIYNLSENLKNRILIAKENTRIEF